MNENGGNRGLGENAGCRRGIGMKEKVNWRSGSSKRMPIRVMRTGSPVKLVCRAELWQRLLCKHRSTLQASRKTYCKAVRPAPAALVSNTAFLKGQPCW